MRRNRSKVSVSSLILFGAAAAALAPATTRPVFAQLPEGVTVGGSLEVNYTANLNEPYTNSNTFLYNQREGQFSINLVDLRVSKAATPKSRSGFMMRLVGGEVSRLNFNSGDDNRVLEAYGTWLLPFGGRDLKVDVGQFVTHVGYETIDIGTNNFFSRNFLFQFPSPFYNAGVRASFPLGSKTTFTGLILNRYNGVTDDGNRDLAPGFQIAHTLSGTSSLVLNGLFSREQGSVQLPDTDNESLDLLSDRQEEIPNFINAGRPQSVLDLVYTNQFNPSLKFVLEALWRFGKDYSFADDGNDYSVGGVAGYLIYGLKSGNVLGLRGEYVSGSPVTNARPLSSITGSFELKSGLFPGARTLFEVRHDISAAPGFFPGKTPGESKDNQTTLTFGQVFNF